MLIVTVSHISSDRMLCVIESLNGILFDFESHNVSMMVCRNTKERHLMNLIWEGEIFPPFDTQTIFLKP